MQFLFVSDFKNNPNSGAAGSLISIGESICQLGHSVDYIWQKPLAERFVKSSNFYRFLELPFIQYREVKAALLKKHYDVVIISQPHAWLAFKKLKKEFPGTLLVNRTHGWEKRIEINTWHIEADSLSLKSLILKKIAFLFVKRFSYLTVKHSDLIICACSSDANFIKNDYPEFSDKVYTVSYGLDKDYLGIELAKNSLPTDDKLRFIYTGQYVKRKGTEDLRAIFSELTKEDFDFELTFIINNNSVEAVKKDFEFLGKSLKVISWIERLRLIEEYKRNDIFLMASYGEGFGKTTIEAMACGLCVIGYKDGALLDYGVNGKNAMLTDIGSKEELLDMVRYLLKNKVSAKSLGLQAYYDVQSLSWEKCGRKTIELINKFKDEPKVISVT